MNIKEFIAKLAEFPEDMEVIISDGMEYHFYNTNELDFHIFEDKLDIGIGSCQEKEENE